MTLDPRDLPSTQRQAEEQLPNLAEALVQTYAASRRSSHLGHRPLPSREAIVAILDDLMDVFYPGYYRKQNLHLGNVIYHTGDLIDGLYDSLTEQIGRALRFEAVDDASLAASEVKAPRLAMTFLEKLPALRLMLEDDVQAALDGDPAATSFAEIVFCYPGLQAITVQRIAHELLNLGVPLIPRMMTEHVHAKTGIDIHPGAKIGRSFFIDHGTGVVIGATCVIGDRVRIYQGVTLGALSFQRDAAGALVRGTKRHPTLEDDVVVYANATILGGSTVIGHHAAIGSNVWLTHSVEPYAVVTIEKPSLRFRGQDPSLSYEI
jgi:serine O-acetyltransferase